MGASMIYHVYHNFWHACYRGKLEEVNKWILDYDLDVTKENNKALKYAYQNSDTDKLKIIERLLERGAALLEVEKWYEKIVKEQPTNQDFEMILMDVRKEARKRKILGLV